METGLRERLAIVAASRQGIGGATAQARRTYGVEVYTENFDVSELSNSIRAGVPGLVRSLANEYGPFDITVNNVGPGYTATDRMKNLAEKRAKAGGISTAEFESRVAKDIPLGRIARPEEVADAIVWLASERASYITGQTILVDGGLYRGL